MAIKDARCNVPPCPSCAAKDAEIERLRDCILRMEQAWLTDLTAGVTGSIPVPPTK